MLVLAALAIFQAPSWLVVEGNAHNADLAVVLGGGGGSRFSTGLTLYDAGMVDGLLLVDINKAAWKSIVQRLCPDCETVGKSIVILEKSTSTFTDAELVAQYCRIHDIKSILVITDPYFTRRASLIFHTKFAQGSVDVSVLSSGDFMGRLSPDENWWQDDSTLKIIWGEMSKIAIIFSEK